MEIVSAVVERIHTKYTTDGELFIWAIGYQ